MLPTILEIGWFKIHSFGLMMALSFLVSTIMGAREFRRRGLNPEYANEAGLGAMIGGVLGAKIYYLVDHWSELLADPGGMLTSFGSGLTWYGGLIGGTLGALYAARLRRIPLPVFVDIAAPILPIGYAIGRMGCFLNGDDYGRPSHAPWAMAFPKGTPPTPEGVLVHPTQLYEVFAGILTFFILSALKDRFRPGALFGLYLLLAGLARFMVEFVRTNEPGLLGLTFAQWISVLLMAAGVILFRPTGRQPDVAAA